MIFFAPLSLCGPAPELLGLRYGCCSRVIHRFHKKSIKKSAKSASSADKSFSKQKLLSKISALAQNRKILRPNLIPERSYP
jgi:hypothetical protein